MRILFAELLEHRLQQEQESGNPKEDNIGYSDALQRQRRKPAIFVDSPAP